VSDPSPDEATRMLAARYTSLSSEYAELWSPVIRPMGQRLLSTLHLTDVKRLLDVGTGVGGLIQDLRRAAPRATLVGIDRSEGMLRVAKHRGIPLAVMDGTQLGIASDSFDAAVLAFVVFLFQDPAAGLSEVGRVLRSGGVVGIATWGDQPSFAASTICDQELDAHHAGADPTATLAKHEQVNTPDRLAALLELSGFCDVHTWAERFEQRWDREGFFALRTRYGSHRRRLDTLDVSARADCLARFREQLDVLDAGDLVYRPEIVFGTARKPR
jgi:SAM-dependent methyltransferase